MKKTGGGRKSSLRCFFKLWDETLAGLSASWQIVWSHGRLNIYAMYLFDLLLLDRPKNTFCFEHRCAACSCFCCCFAMCCLSSGGERCDDNFHFLCTICSWIFPTMQLLPQPFLFKVSHIWWCRKNAMYFVKIMNDIIWIRYQFGVKLSVVTYDDVLNFWSFYNERRWTCFK